MFHVIIANSDFNYCEGLQAWLLNKYAELVDIEVITDKNYYSQLFQSRREIELAIVTDEFFGEFPAYGFVQYMIVLHDTEEEVGETESSSMIHVNKYSDTQLIFHAIEKRFDTHQQALSAEKERISKIVLITSSSGGVGKTTVALGLSAALNRLGKSVLYIDAEYLQTFTVWMEETDILESPECSRESDFCEAIEEGRMITYDMVKQVIRAKGFSYLPPFRKSLISIDQNLTLFTDIIHACLQSKEYDYIIVDTGKEYSLEKAGWMGMADTVMIVMEKSRRCLFDFQSMCKEIADFDYKKYQIIVNKVNNDKWKIQNDDRLVQIAVHSWKNSEIYNFETLSSNKDYMRLTFLL